MAKLKIKATLSNVDIISGVLQTTTSSTGTLYPLEWQGTKTNGNVKDGKLVITK